MPKLEDASFREDLFQIGGVRIHVRRAGSGEPLLWLHGAGGVFRVDPFFEALAEKYCVYLIDQPGFGRSERPGWLRDYSDLNYFYRDFLAHFDLDSVNLVGHSLGGRTALEFAISHPQNVRKLVLIAPGGQYIEGVSRPDVFILNPEQRTRLLFHDQKLADQALARSLSDEEHEMVAKNMATHARLDWEKPYNPRFPRLLRYVNAPTRIIWGADDRVIPLAHGEAYATHISGSELKVIPDCGHLPQVEQKDACLDLIDEFLG